VSQDFSQIAITSPAEILLKSLENLVLLATTTLAFWHFHRAAQQCCFTLFGSQLRGILCRDSDDAAAHFTGICFYWISKLRGICGGEQAGMPVSLEGLLRAG
jgi:hypothetical protein